MSIIKNDARNIRNTGLTIAILPSNARIPLPNNYNYGTLEYIAMKGQALDTTYMWYTGAGETVVLKCEIEQNASGTIYGTTSSAGYGIKIVKDGANIKWYNGSTLVHTQAWSAGVHYIGWVATDDTHSCPFYDNVSYTSEAVALSQHSLHAGVGGLNNNNTMGSFLTSSAAWAMKLYEVIAYSYLTDTYSNMFKYRHQLYAAHALNETTYYGMLDLRYSLTICRPTPTSTDLSSLNGPRVQYGVQVHDIKEICNSPFNDLVAIASELGLNGGVDTDAGWTANNADSPSKVTSLNVEHKFAFYMGSASDHIPLPSDATVTGTPQLPNYEKGELIRGLKPKWSIWNDAIRFGKHVPAYASGSERKMKFNLFAESDGNNNGKLELEHFNGYNTSKNYAPHFEISDSLAMEYHNGYACTIVAERKLTGGSSYDEGCTFAYTSLVAEGLGNIRLGNLPPWNFTQSELQSSVGLSRMVCVGGGLKFSLSDDDAMYLLRWTDENIPLCAGSSDATKALLKTGGFSGDVFFRSTLAPRLKWALLSGDSVNLTARMILVTDKNVVPVSNSDVIDCSALVPTKNIPVTGNFNNRIYSGAPSGTRILYGDRMLIGEEEGVSTIGNDTYAINIGSQGKSDNVARMSVDVSPHNDTLHYYGDALGVLVGLMPKDGNTPLTILGSGATECVAYVEGTAAAAYTTQSNTSVVGRFFGFTKLITNEYDNSPYGYPFNQSAWNQRRIWPTGYLAGYSQIAAALFMWQDLINPGSERGSGGVAPTYAYDSADYPRRFEYYSGTTKMTDARVTAHIKIFAKSDAPHCWDVKASNNRKFDTATESPYIVKTGKYDMMFNYSGDGNLIKNNSTKAIDAWLSFWDGDSIKIRGPQIWDCLNGCTIKVYSQPVYEPQDQRVSTLEFSHTISGASGDYYQYDVTADWRLRIDFTPIPFWIRGRNNTKFFGQNGVNMQVIARTAVDMRAKMYFITIE